MENAPLSATRLAFDHLDASLDNADPREAERYSALNEVTSPSTFYLPAVDIALKALTEVGARSFCEWMGGGRDRQQPVRFHGGWIVTGPFKGKPSSEHW